MKTPEQIRQSVKQSAARVRAKARGRIVRPTLKQINDMRRALAAVDADPQKSKTQ